jgi:hypothetical protein
MQLVLGWSVILRPTLKEAKEEDARLELIEAYSAPPVSVNYHEYIALGGYSRGAARGPTR